MSTSPALARSPSGARRSDRFRQADVLREALSRLDAARAIAVFDLDSTLLDNRPRQARIVREFGQEVSDPRLEKCGPEHWEGWSIELALRNCGLTNDEVARVAPDAKRFWRDRFFTSEYCRNDVANPGAPRYVEQVLVTRGTVCYVTGRHTEMRSGTLISFEQQGFPRPDGERIHLLLKPEFNTHDDDWKVMARARLKELGRVACAFDNEPSHINSYREGFPDCYAVHVDTDHSGRPVEIRPEIPSIRDFRM